MSEALRKAKAEIVAQIIEQQRAKSDAEALIKRSQATKAAKQRELSSASSWYKFWYWKIWSNKKKTLENDIKALDITIAKMTSLISTIQAQIKKLEAERDATHDAVGAAETLEKSLTTLEGEIQQKEEVKASTTAANAASRAAQKK